MAEKDRDMTKVSSVAGFTKWFRKQAKAHVVIVVRENDWVFCVDPSIRPRDAEDLVAAELPRMRELENIRRIEARKQAEASKR